MVYSKRGKTTQIFNTYQGATRMNQLNDVKKETPVPDTVMVYNSTTGLWEARPYDNSNKWAFNDITDLQATYPVWVLWDFATVLTPTFSLYGWNPATDDWDKFVQ